MQDNIIITTRGSNTYYLEGLTIEWQADRKSVQNLDQTASNWDMFHALKKQYKNFENRPCQQHTQKFQKSYAITYEIKTSVRRQ